MSPIPADDLPIPPADLVARLRQQRASLALQLRERLHGGADDQEMSMANYFAAGSEAAEASQSSDIDLALLDHEVAELKAVDLALRRIDTGQYGVCEHCGLPIAALRLKAQPYATLCLECQQAAEAPR